MKDLANDTKKITVVIPLSTYEKLKTAAKNHYRSFNGELIFALEQYLEFGKHTVK